MNYNEIKDAQERTRLKLVRPAPTPVDIRAAEMATQVIGHPGWQMLYQHMHEMLQTSVTSYEGTKNKMVAGFLMPHEYHWFSLQARELSARIAVLKELMDFLPKLIEKTSINSVI